MRQHLNSCHQCDMVTNCGRHWAISDDLEFPVEIFSSQEPREVSTSDANVDLACVKPSLDSLPGEQCSCHAVTDHIQSINHGLHGSISCVNSEGSSIEKEKF